METQNTIGVSRRALQLPYRARDGRECRGHLPYCSKRQFRPACLHPGTQDITHQDAVQKLDLGCRQAYQYTDFIYPWLSYEKWLNST